LIAFSWRLVALTDPHLVGKLPNHVYDYCVHESPPMTPYRLFKMHLYFDVPSNPRFSNLNLTLCFPSTTSYAFLLPRKRTTCPAHHILLGLKCHIIVAESYWIRGSYFLNFLHFHATSSFWYPYILPVQKLQTSVARLPALNKRDRILPPRNGKEKIIFLCILMFIHLASERDGKRFWTRFYQEFSTYLAVYEKLPNVR
jgi:hypothetical protein